MIVWLFVGAFICIAIISVVPFVLAVAALAAAMWIIGKLISIPIDRANRNFDRRMGILQRAEQQHAQIMAGKEVQGTFGQYLPPKEFRYVGTRMPAEKRKSK